MTNTLYFTICSANYLAYARTLAASLRESDPAADFVVFLADRCPIAVIAGIPDLRIIPVDKLGVTTLVDMAFRYDIVEFNTALKPICFQHAFEKLRADYAVYLDPDIFILRQLRHVSEAFADGAECVLIPHITAPLESGKESRHALDLARRRLQPWFCCICQQARGAQFHCLVATTAANQLPY